MKLLQPIVLLLFLVSFSIEADAQAVLVTDTSGNEILSMQDNQVVESSTGDILFNIRGNLIFSGTSDKKRDIWFLVKSRDLFARTKGEVLQSNMKDVAYTLQNGKFYLGALSTLVDEYLMGYYKGDNEGGLIMINATNDEPMAYVKGDNYTTAELVTAFFLVSEWNSVKDTVLKRAPRAISIDRTENTDEGGTIKRMWGNTNDEFVWDGYTLRRRWNSWDFEEWTFDGSVLKRAWYSDGREEFIWDGQLMVRRWGSSPDEFIWDGSSLRRRWGGLESEFYFQGNIIKRQLDTTGNDQWQIDGNIPVPVIALVVYNLLRR